LRQRQSQTEKELFVYHRQQQPELSDGEEMKFENRQRPGWRDRETTRLPTYAPG